MIERLSVATAQQAYRSSSEHLRAELARVDLFVRAQVARWRMTIGATKPEHLWGMVHVTDAEIDRYLAAPIGPAAEMPESLTQALRPYWTAEARAAESISQAVDQTPASVDLRVNRLQGDLHLTDVERDVLLIALLPEVDARYRRIFGYLRDDATKSSPTIDLLLQMLAPALCSLESMRTLFEPGSRLRACHLVSITHHDDSRSGSSVTVDERVASFLLGSDEFDSRLRGLIATLSGDVGWDELFCDEALVDSLRQLACASMLTPAVVRFQGSYGSGRRTAARALATAMERPMLCIDLETALRDPARWNLIVDLAYREVALWRGAIYWHGVERLQQEDQPTYRWQYLLDAAMTAPALTIFAGLGSSDSSRRFDDARVPRFDFAPPHYEMRRRIWQAYLPASDDFPNRTATADTLASVFQLSAGQVRGAVHGAVAIARRRDFARPSITLRDVQEACRRQAGHRLVSFARRIEPTRPLTIDDVILHEPTKRQLRELLDRVRLRSQLRAEMGIDELRARGRGLLVMLAGPSGTGKTLSAELVASQQGLDLYKVDLSAVVSKWVGETEKNLSRVFSEAEDSDALLFFDECDSLFGQRGQVSDARDRWANLQVNYLLQRVEEYSGVVVMATNLRKNIDDAFLRRIQVIIEFPAPDAALRLQIWQRLLPARSEILDGELREVADRFNFTGGSIRNVSVDAAFRALSSGRRAVTLRDLVASAAREYQKLGRPITQGDFGDVFYRWVLSDILSPTPRG